MRSIPFILMFCCLTICVAPGLADEATSPDGVTIRYDVHGAGEPALVFVHGWSCDRGYWRHQVAEFAETHTVVTVDLGGHGDSGTGRADWTIQAYAADVAAVVEDLGRDGVVLIGHSMSGPIVVEAASLLPGRVRGLICVDTMHDVTQRYSTEQIEGIMASMSGGFVAGTDAFVRSMFPEDADPDLVNQVAADMSAAPPAIALSAMRNLFMYDQQPALAGLDIPVRCLNATLWPYNLEGNRTVYNDIALITQEDVGHFLFLEAPDAFNGKLAEILRSFEN